MQISNICIGNGYLKQLWLTDVLCQILLNKDWISLNRRPFSQPVNFPTKQTGDLPIYGLTPGKQQWITIISSLQTNHASPIRQIRLLSNSVLFLIRIRCCCNTTSGQLVSKDAENYFHRTPKPLTLQRSSQANHSRGSPHTSIYVIAFESIHQSQTSFFRSL